VLPEGRRALIERSSWKVPPVFNLIQKIGGVAQREMDSTFNNGLGMILVVGKKDADSIAQTLKKIGEKFFIVGEIQNGPRAATIRS
jgi:phosphoribosylformylglycinamidine cyclo-ligase